MVVPIKTKNQYSEEYVDRKKRTRHFSKNKGLVGSVRNMQIMDT